MHMDDGSSRQPRQDVMARGSRMAAAVAAGYLLAFYVAGADVVSWFFAAIAASGTLAAIASVPAFPSILRLTLGAISTALFTVLGVLGIPLGAGLLIGAFLVGGGTMSLFDSRGGIRSGDIAAP